MWQLRKAAPFALVFANTMSSANELGAAPNHYTNLQDFLMQTHVDANLRIYYFERDFALPSLSRQTAFSLGGKVNVKTAPLGPGFSLGGTLYTAQPLGFNHNSSSNQLDFSLPGTALTTWGQAYAEFKNPIILCRYGDQLISTPWLNEADSRMIPAAFQGFYATLQPRPNISLQFMRLNRFKNRIEAGFHRKNLYDNPIIKGNVPALTATHDKGVLAGAVQFKNQMINAQLWAYEFYDYTKLVYADGLLNIPLDESQFIKPFIGLQGGRQHGTGEDRLFAVGMGNVRTDFYGIQVGSQIAQGKLTLNYNHITKKKHGYLNGNIVSPYTFRYVYDPLYTSSMISGLVEKAAGQAVKITASYNFYADQLKLSSCYANYYTAPYMPNTHETDFDIIILPHEFADTLTLRYRLGFLSGNPNFGRFTYHRLMFEWRYDEIVPKKRLRG